MKRKRPSRKERLNVRLNLIQRQYDEKAINPKNIFAMVDLVHELIFSKKAEANIKSELNDLQREGKEYRHELKNAFQCQELIRHYKLTLIELITKI